MSRCTIQLNCYESTVSIVFTAEVHTLYCLTLHACHREAKDLRDVLLTNVVGTYMVTKAFLPLIRKGHKKQVRADC